MDLTWSESEEAFRAEARSWLEANVPTSLPSGDTEEGFALVELAPDVTMKIDRVSALVLIAAHLVAAAIVVPALARRLATGGPCQV